MKPALKIMTSVYCNYSVFFFYVFCFDIIGHGNKKNKKQNIKQTNKKYRSGQGVKKTPKQTDIEELEKDCCSISNSCLSQSLCEPVTYFL